ncbi:MAG: AMP-binding protein [Pseudomonadales bacterium]
MADEAHHRSTRDASRADTLLGVVRDMVIELHPGRARRLRVRLDSNLERDLGFDSLSRVELLLRLNQTFGVTMDESLVESAETPGDLLAALDDARTQGDRDRQITPTEAPQPLAPSEGIPADAATLNEALQWHAQTHPDRPHIFLHGEGHTQTTLTYQDLWEGAAAVAGGLHHQGLAPGSNVSIMLPTSREYLCCFFGVLLAGCVPLPIYPPTRPSQIEDHLRRHARILGNAEAALLITVERARSVARLLKAQVPSLERVVMPEELTRHGRADHLASPQPDDVALLQYTSGSTGDPKGVVLTHADLIANIRAMGDAIEVDAEDVFVSWLPLYHDMGLIGAWLGSLYYGIPLVLMSPLAFLTNPGRWLRAIGEHRGTLSAAPNFGYELCLKRIPQQEIAQLDLSSWRFAFNGAEPVSPNTLRAFAERFAPAGLRWQSLAPVYGLAEAAVGLAFTPVNRGPIIDRIDRELFLRSGRATPVAADDARALEFVACGQPLEGYQLRIVDEAGRELPDRTQGRLQFTGPSATQGYFRNPEATERLFSGEWLDTGDLAYIADGDLYLTSRVKDTIIRAGRNLYPYELEEAIGKLPRVRAGCVAVFGAREDAGGTERLIVVAETAEHATEVQEELTEEIVATASDILGTPPDDVVMVPPHTVLKTSSGKIRRSAMKDLYESGRLGQKPPPAAVQFLRVGASAALANVRGWRSRLGRLAFAAYVHVLFWVLTPIVWLLVVLSPSMALRWAIIRGGARLLLLLTGMRPRVEGIDNLPRDRPCVIVSNHASYVDGLVLVAALPVRFTFIAKAELQSQFIAGTFLRRISAMFVERFDTHSGVQDARRATQALHDDVNLLFFPEGTFTRSPGLRPFRTGAFSAAAERGVPVVPVTLLGTRSVLRGDSRFPQHHPIHVHVDKPIDAPRADWHGAMQLKNRARAAILDHLNEPDLIGSG